MAPARSAPRSGSGSRVNPSTTRTSTAPTAYNAAVLNHCESPSTIAARRLARRRRFNTAPAIIMPSAGAAGRTRPRPNRIRESRNGARRRALACGPARKRRCRLRITYTANSQAPAAAIQRASTLSRKCSEPARWPAAVTATKAAPPAMVRPIRALTNRRAFVPRKRACSTSRNGISGRCGSASLISMLPNRPAPSSMKRFYSRDPVTGMAPRVRGSQLPNRDPEITTGTSGFPRRLGRGNPPARSRRG